MMEIGFLTINIVKISLCICRIELKYHSHPYHNCEAIRCLELAHPAGIFYRPYTVIVLN